MSIFSFVRFRCTKIENRQPHIDGVACFQCVIKISFFVI